MADGWFESVRGEEATGGLGEGGGAHQVRVAVCVRGDVEEALVVDQREGLERGGAPGLPAFPERFLAQEEKRVLREAGG